MTERLPAIDRLRGLAIVLMIADHLLAASGSADFLRATVTRLSLPIFMCLAGWLLRSRNRPSARRLVELILAAAAATLIVGELDFMQAVDVLVVFAVCLIVWPVARKMPLGGVTACFVLMATVPNIWDGYHPAEVLGLMLCGRWFIGSQIVALGNGFPAWLAIVGRWPLTIYVGHLTLLLLFVEVF